MEQIELLELDQAGIHIAESLKNAMKSDLELAKEVLQSFLELSR